MSKHKYVYKYLFYIENSLASMYRYEDCGLVAESKKGESKFLIDNNFWNDWKKIASYDSNQYVDFCIISDEKYDVLEYCHDFKSVDNSSWSCNSIEKFLNNYCKYTHINLNINDGAEIRKFDKSNEMFQKNKSIDLFANIRGYNVSVKKQIVYDDKAVFSLYYQELLKEQKEKI